MTRAEIIAYNRGVLAALDHTRKIAEVIRARTRRPIAEGFAAEALLAFAEESEALMLPVPAATPPARP